MKANCTHCGERREIVDFGYCDECRSAYKAFKRDQKQLENQFDYDSWYKRVKDLPAPRFSTEFLGVMYSKSRKPHLLRDVGDRHWYWPPKRYTHGIERTERGQI